MGGAQTLFTSLLRDSIAPALRREGFKGSGSIFREHRDGVWSVVDFQRSRSSTAEEVRLTINLAVASERLRGSLHDWPVGSPPGEADCALRQRIGFLLPDRPPADYWWIVDADTDLDRLAADLTGYLLDAGLPFLRGFPGDEALRDHWVAALDAGDLSRPDLLRLQRLTAQIGPAELARRLDDDGLMNELEKRWAAESDALQATIENLSERRDSVDSHIRTPRESKLPLFRRS